MIFILVVIFIIAAVLVTRHGRKHAPFAFGVVAIERRARGHRDAELRIADDAGKILKLSRADAEAKATQCNALRTSGGMYYEAQKFNRV